MCYIEHFGGDAVDAPSDQYHEPVDGKMRLNSFMAWPNGGE